MRRVRLRPLLRLSLILYSLLLYAVAGLIIYAFQIRQSRIDLHYLLYSQAESAASYVATTGKWDFPELVGSDEESPARVFLRVIERDQVLAQTPEFPNLPLAHFEELKLLAAEGVPEARSEGATGAHHDEAEEEEELGKLLEVKTAEGQVYPMVRHVIWNRPESYVEALTRPDAMGDRLRQLLMTLLVTGMILLPLAVIGAELLARRLGGPIERLISSVREIQTQNLCSRLPVDQSFEEIALLAIEFNELLHRIEGAVLHMRRFTANASHELRTPISSLRAGIDVCLRRPRSAEEYRQVLEEGLQEIDRMQRVVEGLLALAREPSGAEATASHEAVELGQVVQRAVKILMPLAQEKQLVVERKASGSSWVAGDAAQLELMVINLLDNAIRHGPRGSKIRLCTSEQGERVRLWIADQGPGVPEEERPHIFERHFQGHPGGALPRSARTGGIGLDLVRWVVKLHQGEVRLVDASEPGAQFEILLPRLVE